MNNATLSELSKELSSELRGRRLNKIQQISEFECAFDFRLKENRLLLISTNTSSPRIYLARKLPTTPHQSTVFRSPFILLLRKELHQATVVKVEKVPNDRILRLKFVCDDVVAEKQFRTLVIQLTGRSSNLALLDDNDFILAEYHSRRNSRVGEVFKAPTGATTTNAGEAPFPLGDFPSISDALEDYFLSRESAHYFDAKAANAQEALRTAIKNRKKLASKLTDDLARHGAANQWKRYGELILANLANARIVKTQIFVIDHFDEAAPEIAIEMPEDLSPKELAEYFFKRYSKSRSAEKEISRRLNEIESELINLSEQQDELALAIEQRDEARLDKFRPSKPSAKKTQITKRASPELRCARKFLSSDGMEILVGKAAKDNDELTFKVAKSMDWWFHAADYAGSHVIVRNPTRKELPQKTFLEAAHLAAFYSQAKKHPKAAVHYTQKKFVSKPRGAAFGLVRLAQFKTILVEPRIPFDDKSPK